ncbi:hypothetical protein A3709_01695 [Halioglobus sp. HI00S01]|uniref:TonB-dependent receptor n=1 Tax=Halioglobus sp. HI00S01 TaxID=1822214 RepID=UPI0007C40A3C|nr:TonB-dependent receptor [Halioglobus sp. HI00S01]KZX58207.1 hypothetical protein A3709_01695 [Halioglobus sp. HI00S01]
MASHVAANVEETLQFTLDSPRLSSALIQLSQQSGLAIVFSDRQIRDLPSTPVVGASSTAEALDRILRGTSLTWEVVDDRIIAVYPRECSPGVEGCAGAAELVAEYPIYAPGLEETWVYGTTVTGSRIRRTGYTGGAPVDILSSPDIELSGAQTLGELLKFIPAVSGNAISTAISNGGDGTATVTLRGLPASNTLVLINGRRVANDGLAGDSVDLNSISPAAVERIEILKDGASAIYGSDAIAGVVNVIMKRDFHGFLAETFYGETSVGDLNTTTHTLQYGTGLPEGSFFVSASYYEQGAIFSRDREVSSNADTRAIGGTDQRSSATPNSRIAFPDGETLIAEGSGYRAATVEDLFNYQAFTTAVVPLERSSIYGNASYDFNESITGYVELSYLKTNARSTLAPTPVFTGFETEPLVVAADNIYNPFGEELLDVRRRLVELPTRRQRNESRVSRFSAVIEGLFSEWHWDIGYNWSRSEASEVTSNIVNADNLRRALGPSSGCQGLALDGCIPINLTGPAGSITKEQADYITAVGEVSGYSHLSSGSINVTRAMQGLPAGRLDLAMGLEVRHESTRKRPSPLLANIGTIGATNFEPTRGDRNIIEIYAEAILPVWKSASNLSHFDVEAAVRYSDYNDFDDTINPKLALHWQVGPEFLLRTNYAEGFRAPSLNELFAGVTESQDFLEDPCTRPKNVSALPGCSQLADPSRNQFLTLKGGNTELRPETSNSYSAGLVWTPVALPGLAVSVDYFIIDQGNVVSSSAQFIVNQSARDSSFQDRVERDAQGNLTLVRANNINIGKRKVSGADTALTYHYRKGPWGQFSLVGSSTYMRGYKARLNRTASRIDFAGTFRDEASEGLGGIPEWKAQLGLRWARDRWRGSWQMHYVGSMEELVPGIDNTREIDSWLVHDLQLSYTVPVLGGLRLTLGVDNLLGAEAPLAASAFNDNIDGRTHELKGRFWYSRISQRL